METLAVTLDRIGRLIPSRSTNVNAQGAYVLTSPAEVPEPLRAAQQARNTHYLTVHDETSRTSPSHAPLYWVTSYGVLIAWVTLDGVTHYASDVDIALAQSDTSRTTARTIARHRDDVREQWPDQFIVDGRGDLVYVPGTNVPDGFDVADDPYCAAHGRRFDPSVGCPSCLTRPADSNAPEEDGPHAFEPRDNAEQAAAWGLDPDGCDYCGQVAADPIHPS